MPYGEFQYSMDDKGRVIIPPSFRDFIEDGMIVTRGLEGCLYVFPLPAWDRIEKQLDDLPITDTESRRFVRYFYSGASKSRLDSAGRITIPPTLRTFAGIDGNVLIAGAPHRLEIWSAERWQADIDDVQANPPAPERLAGMIG